jgi:iron complex transport system ATP-binding protein
MTGAMVRFSKLTVRYGDRLVLREIDGTIRQGALTALIGPNGSGKSTLLRAFAGLLPYGGKLTLRERELSGISRRELGQLVGVVPQQTRMAAPFTVYDAVALGRLPHQGLMGTLSEKDKRLIMDAVARTELDRLLFRDVTRLSGGEAQRVALATVLAQDSPVMLLDEPSSALDPRQTLKVFSMLRELTGSGKTVIAAVHDVNLAAAFADFFLAMESGEILSEAPIEKLDEEVLERVYGVPFEPYLSKGGEKAWHAK